MAKRNASRYVLLGLLDWEPMSGYDIKKTVEQSIRDFWHESYGNIYPTLKKFLAEGLAEKTVERHEGKPDRIVYKITTAGRNELVEWLKEPPHTQRARDEFLAKFIFGYLVSKEANIEQIERYRLKLEERLEWYREMEELLQGNRLQSRKKLLEYLTLRQGCYVFQGYLRWCEEVLLALREYPDDKPAKHGSLDDRERLEPHPEARGAS
jgi:DNA-binding PadR family transcriptional regulator